MRNKIVLSSIENPRINNIDFCGLSSPEKNTDFKLTTSVWEREKTRANENKTRLKNRMKNVRRPFTGVGNVTRSTWSELLHLTGNKNHLNFALIPNGSIRKFRVKKILLCFGKLLKILFHSHPFLLLIINQWFF